jgi:hypothetical protein
VDTAALCIGRRVPAHGGAVQLDVAGVGLVSAGDDLCQGRFPGAVFADQRVDLTGFDLEIDLAERLHAWKRLRDLLQPEHLSPQAQRGWQDCVCRPPIASVPCIYTIPTNIVLSK